MANESTSRPKPLYQAVISFIIALPIGAVFGILGEYWISKEQARTDVVRQSYIELLEVTREKNLDLRRHPGHYIEMTSLPVRQLAVHGGKLVLTAMVKEWKYICKNMEKEIPPCCGHFDQLMTSLSVVQNMREEVMPLSDHVDNADMMFLLNFCRLPGPADEEVSCDRQEKEKYCFSG